MEQPKISVILTSYNRPHWLDKAIRSIYEQEYQNWELLILDDYSTLDEVIHVIRKWQIQDPRIKRLIVPRKVGYVSPLWNMGLDQARGDYICFLDDDNMRREEYLQELMRKALETGADITVCESSLIDSEDRICIYNLRRHPIGKKQPDLGKLLQRNFIDSGEMLIKRDVFEKVGWFDERLTTEEDWDFVCRSVAKGMKFYFLSEPLALYRNHPGQRIKHTLDQHRINLPAVRAKFPLPRKIKVLLVSPRLGDLTLSQRFVCDALFEGLEEVYQVEAQRCYCNNAKESLVTFRPDLTIVVAPFRISVRHLMGIKDESQILVSIHLEDPWALRQNLDRARFFDWIVTNERGCVDAYRKEFEKFGKKTKKIICMPSLSAKFERKQKQNKIRSGNLQLCFLGHPYPSRIRFFRKLLNSDRDFPLVVAGPEWERYLPEHIAFSDWSYEKGIKLMQKSGATLALNRDGHDCGKFSDLVPVTPSRGFQEMYSGALVFSDKKRREYRRHFLDGGNFQEIITFNNVEDLIEKFHGIQKDRTLLRQISERGHRRAQQNFTYKTRLSKLIHAILSPRYDFLIV